jgi:general secretion pathway protein D
MTTDQQQATVFVGQSVPYITGSNVSSLGTVTNTIARENVGVQMIVTPKISPEGRIIMRVTPTVSKVSETQIVIGNGETAPRGASSAATRRTRPRRPAQTPAQSALVVPSLARAP